MPTAATANRPAAAPARPPARSERMMALGAPLELKAAADGVLPSKFSGTAYSGGFVPDYEVVIDMATTTYKQRMPLLDNHYRGAIIGVIEQAATEQGAMVVGGRLFSDMPASGGERIAQLAQRGVPFEMSVGIYAFSVERVPAGKSISVNGQVFNGPVNVLRNGQVREVSIVTLGADPRTDAQFFNLHDFEDSNPMDLAQLQAQVAQLTQQIAGHAAALEAARAEGATAERARIQQVQAQAMPGHEALILSLAFDGKTTGPEAAVQVLNAERALRSTAAAQLAADAPKPLPAASTPPVQGTQQQAAALEAGLPLEQRCKAQWERDAALRAEFNSLEAFTAYTRAQEGGRVRLLGKKAA